ncbi:uncharacterized protein LOC141789910 [Halichoeres trimaculatus]|uniref:uncharacterized protein LOC141789910 n=1 Tax=Halichoeres trimaculatus TaxID=147232 RepID=UPI003D9DB905
MDHRKAAQKRKHLEEDQQSDSSSSQESWYDASDVAPGCKVEEGESSFTSTTSSSANSTASSTSSSSSTGRSPSKSTLYKRRKRAEKDMEVLQKVEDWGPSVNPVGFCHFCGQARHRRSKHGYFRGQFYCWAKAGPGQTLEGWLEEQQEANKQPVGKKTKRACKPKICAKCGFPRQKDFGHSQHKMGDKKVSFCALHQGKSAERWLAEIRTGQWEETLGLLDEEESIKEKLETWWYKGGMVQALEDEEDEGPVHMEEEEDGRARLEEQRRVVLEQEELRVRVLEEEIQRRFYLQTSVLSLL